MPAVTLHPDPSESIYTQSGGMVWMSADIRMDTNMKGGLRRGLGRLFSGESMFKNTYTATGPSQSITFGSSFPGSIVVLDVARGPYICQRSAFLCAEMGVDLKTTVPKGLKGAIFGGEGLFMQELTGSGMAFIEIDGSVKEIDLKPG